MPESLLPRSEDFEALYSRYFQMVYRICYTYMQNYAEAEDCTEDTFVKLLTKQVSFQDEQHEKAWLTITAINVCKDRLKHWWHKYRVTIEHFEISDEEKSFQPNDILHAVMNLPPKYKDVIYLYYYMGYSTDEIACMLNKPSSTVRNHMREARLLLKDKLGGEDDEA